MCWHGVVSASSSFIIARHHPGKIHFGLSRVVKVVGKDREGHVSDYLRDLTIGVPRLPQAIYVLIRDMRVLTDHLAGKRQADFDFGVGSRSLARADDISVSQPDHFFPMAVWAERQYSQRLLSETASAICSPELGIERSLGQCAAEIQIGLQHGALRSSGSVIVSGCESAASIVGECTHPLCAPSTAS